MSRPISVLAVLTDRKSNNTQILSLAKAITKDENIHRRTVFFNNLVKMPNFLLSIIPVWLTLKKNEEVYDIDHCDILITCGRRSVRYARHLKKYKFKNAKIVQIMNPDFLSYGIDLLLLPEHDRSYISHKNIIRFRGSLISDLENQLLPDSKEYVKSIEQSLKPPYISVVIGGNSKNFKFQGEMIEEFMRRVNLVAKNMNATLLITNSPRTSKHITDLIKKNLHDRAIFYDYHTLEKNPYHIFLNIADYNIVTGDSISMVSELISTGKPTYVFTDGIKSRKYNHFHNSIILNNSVRELRRDLLKLENFRPNKINDLDAIAKIVLEKLNLI